jgi:hypothetical protein
MVRLCIQMPCAEALPVTATLREAASVPRHVKITGAAPAFGFERCEDADCRVAPDGFTTSCGRLACPVCGCGGTNLMTFELIGVEGVVSMRCSCGHAWSLQREHAGIPAGIAVSA